nr:MAG TPA: hypothetical protein [Caudoviricetes sp.]
MVFAISSNLTKRSLTNAKSIYGRCITRCNNLG